MSSTRLLVLAPLVGAIALSAPAVASAAVDQTLDFGTAGTVHVQDPSPNGNANEVRFTMPNRDTARAFIQVRAGEGAHIALGNATALGVPHAVYTDVSTPSCQVYTGTTFGEADETLTAEGLAFDIRKDELAPSISVALEDNTAGTPNCLGFDGASAGRPVSFGASGAVTGLEWQQPGDATNLRAIPGPHAITLAWTPPADALGVRYEIRELQPNGTFVGIDSAVGSSYTANNLVPGVPHTYVVAAFRRWGGEWFSPGAAGPATGVAAEFAPPATVPAAGGSGATAPVAAAAKPPAKGSTAAAKKAAAAAKRPATPRAWKAKARGRRVVITLPKLARGQRFEILRAAKAKGKYGRIATTTRRSYTDRKVRRGVTYRYRLVLVSAAGVRSLPTATITVRVR